MSGKFYPLILYPELIINALSKKAVSINHGRDVNVHQALVKKHKRKSKNKNFINYLMLFLLLVTLLLVFILLTATLALPKFIFLVLMMLAWGVYSLIIPFKHNKKHRQKNQDVNLRKYQLNCHRSNSNNQQELSSLLSGKVLKPTGFSNAPQGVSEAKFFHQLQLIFPDVKQGVSFAIPNSSYAYAADFILQHSTGVSLDIEVDEPYIGNSKQPHHALDRHNDTRRNNFFLTHNWIVIRFAEEQVVRYPLRCCKTIAEVLSRVCNDASFSDKLSSVPNLAPYPLWTAKQARQMAKKNYRQTYLRYST